MPCCWAVIIKLHSCLIPSSALCQNQPSHPTTPTRHRPSHRLPPLRPTSHQDVVTCGWMSGSSFTHSTHLRYLCICLGLVGVSSLTDHDIFKVPALSHELSLQPDRWVSFVLLPSPGDVCGNADVHLAVQPVSKDVLVPWPLVLCLCLCLAGTAGALSGVCSGYASSSSSAILEAMVSPCSCVRSLRSSRATS